MINQAAIRARSWLFPPATRPDRFAKAAAAGADVVILDLEDAVAPKDKAEARATALDYFAGDPSRWRAPRAAHQRARHAVGNFRPGRIAGIQRCSELCGAAKD